MRKMNFFFLPVVKIRPTMKQNRQTTPVKIGLRTRLKMSISNIVQSIPSNIPICEPSPNANNIVKNRTAQIVDPVHDT